MLIHRPLFAKTLAGVTLQYRADLALTVFTAALLGASDAGSAATHSDILPKDYRQVTLLLRLLTPIAKAYTAKDSIAIVQECMESLGGVGYMENVESPEMNVARIFRDANVLSIWEGTTDVLATDTVKVLRGRDGSSVVDALDTWLRATLSRKPGFDAEKKGIADAWTRFRDWLPSDVEEALANGRDVVFTLGNIISATLLIVDAERDQDEVAVEVATRFVRQKFNTTQHTAHAWQTVTTMDQKIAFAGPQGHASAKL